MPEIMERLQMTYGEKAVGLLFNPSGDGKVKRVKELYAEIGVALYNRVHGRFRGSLHADMSPTIRCQVNGNVLCITRDFLRRLTPIECERLQTLPDNYTEGVSNSQRYKMLGNGWTVDVIAHIFREMFRD